MHMGTITEFDSEGQFGLIDGDDGRVIVFNLHDVAPAVRPRFRVGTRVKFDEFEARLGPRAVALRPVRECPPH